MTDITGDERFPAPLSKPIAADLSGFALQLQQGNASSIDAKSHPAAGQKSNSDIERGASSGAKKDVPVDGADQLNAGDSALFVSMMGPSDHLSQISHSDPAIDQAFLPEMKIVGDKTAIVQTLASNADQANVKNHLNSSASVSADSSTLPGMFIGTDAQSITTNSGNATTLMQSDAQLLTSLQPVGAGSASTSTGDKSTGIKSSGDNPGAFVSTALAQNDQLLLATLRPVPGQANAPSDEVHGSNPSQLPTVPGSSTANLFQQASFQPEATQPSALQPTNFLSGNLISGSSLQAGSKSQNAKDSSEQLKGITPVVSDTFYNAGTVNQTLIAAGFVAPQTTQGIPGDQQIQNSTIGTHLEPLLIPVDFKETPVPNQLTPQVVKTSIPVETTNTSALMSNDQNLLSSLQQTHVLTQTAELKPPAQAAVQNVLTGTQVQSVNSDVASKARDIVAGGNPVYAADSVTQTLAAAGFVANKGVASIDNSSYVTESGAATLVSRSPVIIPTADVVNGDDKQRIVTSKIAGDAPAPAAASISTFDSQLLASLQPHTDVVQPVPATLRPSSAADNLSAFQTANILEAPNVKGSLLNTNNYNSDSVSSTLVSAGFIPATANTGIYTKVADSNNAVAASAEPLKNTLVLGSASNADLREVQPAKVVAVASDAVPTEAGTATLLSSYDKQLLNGLQQTHTDGSTSDRSGNSKPPVVPAELATNSVQQQLINFDNTPKINNASSSTIYKADSVTANLVTAGFIPAPAGENGGSSPNSAEISPIVAAVAADQAKSAPGSLSASHQTNLASVDVPTSSATSVKTNPDILPQQELAAVQPAKSNSLSTQVGSLLANLEASATPVKTEQPVAKLDQTTITSIDSLAISTAGNLAANQLVPSAGSLMQTAVQSTDGTIQPKTTYESVRVPAGLALADAAYGPASKTDSKNLPGDKNKQPEFRYVGPGSSNAPEPATNQAVLAALGLRNVFARQSTHIENNGEVAVAGLQALLTQTKSSTSTALESGINAAALSGNPKAVIVLNPSTVISGALIPSDGKMTTPVSLSIVSPTGSIAVQSEQANSLVDAGIKGKLTPLATSIVQVDDIQSPRFSPNIGVVSSTVTLTSIIITGKVSNEIAGTNKSLEPASHSIGFNESGERLGTNGISASRAPLNNADGKGSSFPGRLPINEVLPPELTEIASGAKITGTTSGAPTARTEFVEEGTTRKQGDVAPVNLPVINNILIVPPKIGGKGSEFVEEIDAQIIAPRAGLSGGGSAGTANSDPANQATANGSGIGTASQNDPNSTSGNSATSTQDLVDQLPQLVIVDKNNVAVATHDDASTCIEPCRTDIQNSDASAAVAPRGDTDNLEPHYTNDEAPCKPDALAEPSPHYNNDEEENSTAGARTDCDSLYPDKNLTDETIRISSMTTKNHVDGLSTEDDIKDFVNNLEERRLYQIRKGDTLSSIAKKMLGSTRYIPLLIELNRDSVRLKPDGSVELRPGTYINLPSHSDMMKFISTGDARAVYAQPEQIQSTEVRETYACRYGDTLKTVARRHPALRDARVWTLLAQVNNLSCRQSDKKIPFEKLKRGQILVIPSASEKLEFLQQLPSNVTPKPLTGSIFSNENRAWVAADDRGWPDVDDSHTTVTGDKTVITVDRTQVTAGDTKANNDCTKITGGGLDDAKPVRGKAWIQESRK